MAHVYNTDVQGFHNRINRYIEECLKSVSSSSSLINDFDLTRIKSYLSALRYYHDYVKAQKPLDRPETAPYEYTLRDDPVIQDIENEMLTDIVRKFVHMRDELTNSQSARNATGLIEFDSVRFLSFVEDVEKYIADYVGNAQPLDMPESSPRAEISGPGRGGV